MRIINNEREFTRISVPLHVQVRSQSDDLVEGMTHDISLNGVLLPIKSSIPVGSECDVKLSLGDQDPLVIEVAGIVARSAENMLAINFQNIDVNGFNHLKKLILYNTEDTNQVKLEFDSHLGIHCN
ncbi:MAG: PilZ domain-containing protein [Mariprofundaceae bacterium]